MRALSLALLCLGSVSFLGLEAAKPDLASDFKRRWSKWEQQQQQRRRARRELPSAVPGGGAPEAEGPLLPSSPSKAFVRPPQEAKGEPRSPEEEEASEASESESGHVRVKRYQYHQYHQYQYRPAAPALSQNSTALSQKGVRAVPNRVIPSPVWLQPLNLSLLRQEPL